MNQIQKSLYEFIDSPSIIPDFGDLDGAMKNIRESELRINDTEDNFYHGDKRQDIIRWAAKDKEYRDSLSWFEDLRMTALDPTTKCILISITNGVINGRNRGNEPKPVKQASIK